VLAAIQWHSAGPDSEPSWLWTVDATLIPLVATLAWGYTLGYKQAWPTLLVSWLIGPIAMVSGVGVSDRIAPIGDGPDIGLTYLFSTVALAVLLGAGVLVGVLVRRIRQIVRRRADQAP
jgi:hypothetical protein